MRKIQLIGDLMLLAIKLQIFFFYRVLKGAIIFGIFPGFLFVYRVLNDCIEQKSISHISLRNEVSRLSKDEIVKINILGFGFSIFLWIIGLNRQVIRLYMAAPVLNFLTLLMLIITICTLIYILPILSKYELPITQYLYQAFLLSFISIIDTVAIIFGVAIVAIIAFVFPPFALFMSIPLVFTPYVWFSRNAVKRLENVLYKKIEDK